MFKGLKSKLEDEAKKLQASVQQYGEKITEQVGQMRSNASDAGSDVASVSHRFGNGSASPGPPRTSSVGNALMEEVAEGDLLGIDLPKRERRWSGDSTRSVESSLSTFFQSVPGMASSLLNTVESDEEDISTEFENNKDLEPSRGHEYKSKYKNLVKKYNDLVSNNKKCHMVLTQTQDKALSRIEKLRNEKKILSEKLKEKAENSDELPAKLQKYEVLLAKCTEEIKNHRAKIKELMEDNEKLKAGVESADGESGISSLVAERIANEWKQRIDKVEEEWTERINKSDSDHAIQLATTKADMHAALETKDKEIESWRTKCRALEVQDGQANERWQKKVDELQSVVQALESEKMDMIEKLSTAKQQGVQAVRDEEERKRAESEAEWQKKEKMLLEEAEQRCLELEQRHKEAIEKLTTDLQKSEEFSQQKLQTEVSELIGDHEEIIAQDRKQHEAELTGLKAKLDHAHEEITQLRAREDMLQKEVDNANLANQENMAARNSAQSEQVAELKARLAETEAKLVSTKNDLEARHSIAIRDFNEALSEARQELEQKVIENEEIIQRISALEVEKDEELSSVKSLLEEKAGQLLEMRENCQKLEEELMAAKELSAMQEHLRDELVEARQQHTAVELRVLELIERAEKAEQALAEDRQQLELNKLELEKSMRNTGSEPSELLPEETVQSVDVSDNSLPCTQLDELNMRLVELEERNAALEEQLEELRKEKDVLSEELTTTSSRENALEEKYKEEITTAEETRLRLEAERMTMSQRLDDLQSETTDLISSLQKRADDAESKKELLKVELEEVQKLKTAEEVEATGDLEAKLAEKDQQLLEQQSRLTDVLNELESARSSIAAQTAECEALKEELAKVQTAFSQTKADLEKGTISASELQLSAEQLKEELSTIREHREALEAELVKARKEISSLNDVVQRRDEEKRLLEDKLNSVADEKGTSSAKLQELEAFNERMRVEFISKEKVISDLRQELESVRISASGEKKCLEDQLNELQTQLKQALAEVTSASDVLEEQKLAFESVERKLASLEECSAKEKEENVKIREQYSLALENQKQELAATSEKLQSCSSFESECELLRKELDAVKVEYEQFKVKEKENADIAVQNLHQQAERSLAKAKQHAEQEISAAKAELMLLVDQLRGEMMEKDCKLDDILLEKARLEQELIASGDLKSDLEQRCAKEKELSSKLCECERRLIEVEAENRMLTERKSEFEETKKKLLHDLAEQTRSVEDLQKKVEVLENTNEDAFRKAAAKQDVDSKKVVRELQREVKQLYVELNEKSEALDALRASASKQEDDGTAVKSVEVTPLGSTQQKDYMYEEELESMRRKLNECHREIDSLREVNGMLERNLHSVTSSEKSTPAVIPVNGSAAQIEEPGFADPAQAEYLRNVLFRYMVERESLGKESVTLARVIGTVAKFDKCQLDAVMAKEETRLMGWMGGTVSQVISGSAR